MSLTGIENQDTTIENRVSILDSNLYSREDRESSVNLLLNVLYLYAKESVRSFKRQQLKAGVQSTIAM